MSLPQLRPSRVQFGESLDPIVGPGDKEFVPVFDPNLRADIGNDRFVTLDPDDSTAGFRPYACFSELFSEKLGRLCADDLHVLVQRENILLF